MGSFCPPTTIHSEIVTTFERNDTTGVLHPSGASEDEQYYEQLLAVAGYRDWPMKDNILPTFYRYQHPATAAGLRFIVYELRGQYGILLKARTDQDGAEELRDYTAYLLTKSGADQPIRKVAFSSDALMLAYRFTSLFEERLLFDAFDLKGWKTAGRKLFMMKVAYYTNKRMMVDLALPAFPCKTTNPEKAASTMPDGAEYEALTTLQSFIHDVEKIYKPGCCISIVSDGHVFADCQGTNDALVTKYNEALKVMHAPIQKKDGCTAERGGIQFYNLDRLLFPDAQASLLWARVPTLQPIRHPVDTKIEEHDDLCRTILVRTQAPPEEYLRDLIKTVPGHAITALYRGFSRFMFEDLACSPDFKDATTSQRKRAAETVAFEMIQRNQSYSRLVEGLMPRYIRLSIHAHDNAGPKFAVRLMPFKPVSDSSGLVVTQEHAVAESHSHLHVPTPWHNSLVDVHDGDGEVETMLCKAKVVEDALKEGKFTGEYVKDHERGGRFVITKVKEEE